jgi:hypothetical protein
VKEAAPLVRLLYVGEYDEWIDPVVLKRALGVAHIQNRRGDVTGVYCHSEGCFVEVLEGTPQEAEAAMARCLRSGLCGRLRLVLRSEVVFRRFDGWTAVPMIDIELLRLVQRVVADALLDAALIDRLVELLCIRTELDSAY